MIQTFAALAEPSRFRIVELLRARACTVNQIGKRLGMRQPQVSKHLRVLKEAGLVDVEARAQERVYELSAKPFADLEEWLERYRKVLDARFEALDDLVMELEAKEKTHGRNHK